MGGVPKWAHRHRHALSPWLWALNPLLVWAGALLQSRTVCWCCDCSLQWHRARICLHLACKYTESLLRLGCEFKQWYAVLQYHCEWCFIAFNLMRITDMHHKPRVNWLFVVNETRHFNKKMWRDEEATREDKFDGVWALWVELTPAVKPLILFLSSQMRTWLQKLGTNRQHGNGLTYESQTQHIQMQ